MYKIIKEAHSGIAYLALLGLIIATVYYFVRYTSKKPMFSKQKTISLITMIVVHLQLLLGLILLFISPQVKQVLNDFGATMKEDTLRKHFIEHPITMIVVAALVTIANKKIKSASLQNQSLVATAPILYLLSLALVLYMIPWSVWM